MFESHIAFTVIPDSSEAGTYLGSRIDAALASHPADAAIVFASTRYELKKLLEAFHARCKPKVIIGCSSAGEFVSEQQGEGAATVLALCSDEIKFSVGVGAGLRKNRLEAAKALASSFSPLEDPAFPHRSLLILTDALAGYVDDFLEHFTLQTAGRYQLVGGGAGDDGKYLETYVFEGTNVHRDAAVGLEILSKKPIGIGAQHGWKLGGSPMRVTEAIGNRIISLNATPIIDVFKTHARNACQVFDVSNPLPFFLRTALAVETGSSHKIRVPLQLHEDSIIFAAEIPVGVTVQLATITPQSSLEATMVAIRSAHEQLGGLKPKIAFLFDCIGTRLRAGMAYPSDLEKVRQALGAETMLVGFNTYGQVARIAGQFTDFHNSTGVVCLIPE
ncbi:MAG: FIST N-terminal domain-containing protein [Bdellovibrionota bacterium]